MTDIAKAAQESSDLALWQAYCEAKMALEESADEIERLREALRHLDAIASTGVLHQSSLNHAGLVELLEEARGVARAALKGNSDD